LTISVYDYYDARSSLVVYIFHKGICGYEVQMNMYFILRESPSLKDRDKTEQTFKPTVSPWRNGVLPLNQRQMQSV